MHLSQAINYLHSHHRHIKTWAALFIGGQNGPGLKSSLTLPAYHSRERERGRWEEGRGAKEFGASVSSWGLSQSSLHPAAMALHLACIGYTTCYQPRAVSQMINDMDTKLLFSSEQPIPWACVHTSQPPAACLS